MINTHEKPCSPATGPVRSIERDPSSGDAGHEWGLVLAGGSGKRLCSMTTDARGIAVPKQYCSLPGGEPLLVNALERAERVIARDRIVIVVAREHRRYWMPLLAGRRPQNVVVQPTNRGTAAGILLPLLSIIDRDADARVAIFPSDHFVEDEDVLGRAIGSALRSSESHGQLQMLGVMPDAPVPDYGWILPGIRRESTWSVAAFVEKPSSRYAALLERQGAVWNTFLMVGRGAALLDLYARQQPDLLASFRRARPHVDTGHARRFYGELADVDFSRDLLQGAEKVLRLRVVSSCGWTDLGTPARVARCIALQRARALGSRGSDATPYMTVPRRVAEDGGLASSPVPIETAITNRPRKCAESPSAVVRPFSSLP